MTDSDHFHPHAKTALKDHLIKILESCKIIKGLPELNGKNVFEFLDETQKHKSKWLRYAEPYGIVLRYISDHIDKTQAKPDDITKDLNQILTPTQISNLSEEIVSYIESIPRQYFVLFELNGLEKISVKEILLTDDIAFVEASVSQDSKDPIKLSNLYKELAGNTEPLNNKIYVRVKTKGYASGFLESSAVKNAYSKFKQVVLLGRYSGVFMKEEPKLRAFSQFFIRRHNEVFIYDADEPSKPKYASLLPKSVADYVSTINIKEDALKPKDYEIVLEKIKDKDNLTPQEEEKIFKRHFGHAIKLLITHDDNKDVESIKTAIEWAFDSLSDEDVTLAFIKACIGLEAILGDRRDKEDITKMLSNRCAYLIGKSILNRNEIKDKFEKLYNIRSKLIHGRKAKLDGEEREILSWARETLANCIWREISYIK